MKRRLLQPEPRTRFFRTILVLEVGLGVLSLGIGWLIGYGEIGEIISRLSTPRLFSEDLFWGAIAALPMFALAWLVERSRLGSLRFLRFVVRKLVRDLFLEFSTWQIALVSLAAGVSEEMFFRGILFDAICEKLDISLAAWGLMLVSSLLFGLAHAITRAYLVLATLIGIYLALVLMLFDNLLVPMMTHALYDFVLLKYFLWRLGQQKRNGLNERLFSL